MKRLTNVVFNLMVRILMPTIEMLEQNGITHDPFPSN
jgi:hypothetical protein